MRGSNMCANDALVVTTRRWTAGPADDELLVLWECLTSLRLTAVERLAGVDPRLAGAPLLAGSPLLSLAGVVKHLTAAERFWLSIVGGGSDLPSLRDQDEPDAEWLVGQQDTPDRIIAAYRAEWWRSEESLAGKAGGDLVEIAFDEQDRTVRWLLSHVIQETARHVGHMDVLCELAGGVAA